MHRFQSIYKFSNILLNKLLSDIALKSVLHVRRLKPSRMSENILGRTGSHSSGMESTSSKRCLFDEEILSNVSNYIVMKILVY